MKRPTARLLAGLLACAPMAAHAGGKSGVDGTLDTTQVGQVNFGPSQVSCSTTATLILAQRTNRALATVENSGTTDVFLGGSGVTTSTGLLLPGTKGASANFATQAALYCIVASGTQTVTAAETY